MSSSSSSRSSDAKSDGVCPTQEGEKLLTYEHLLLGGVAGSVAAVCTMPVDVIKTRLQVGSEVGTSAISAARQVYAEKGFSGFFIGVGPRIAYVAGTSAVFFVLFEQWKMVRTCNVRHLC